MLIEEMTKSECGENIFITLRNWRKGVNECCDRMGQSEGSLQKSAPSFLLEGLGLELRLPGLVAKTILISIWSTMDTEAQILLSHVRSYILS